MTLVALAAASTAQSWMMITPMMSPSARRAGAMAFHPPTNKLVIYGGVTATPAVALSDTWTYNGQWAQQTTVAAPARWGHRMVLNSANNTIVTFGGRSPTISGLANDTMVYNGTAWTAVTTANAPSPRFLYGMCYDRLRGVMVLFGGRSALGQRNDTWEFDGSNWTLRTTAHAPAAREEMVMEFDPTLNRVVLFGGCNETLGTVYGDTWFYDGNDWLDVTPPTSPAPRFRTASAFDSVRKRLVMYGGYDNAQVFDETFEFTGDEWTQIPTGNMPPNMTEAYTGYDATRKKLVVFGGFGTTFLNETWEFTGATGGVFGTYGTGCDTVLGEPGIAGSVPTLNQTFTLTFDNLPPTTAAMLVAIGLSNLTWNGLPLPLDLGIIGLSGCNLLAAADFLDVGLAAGGTATYGLMIPNQMSLLNVSLYMQGIVLDVTVPSPFTGATRGGRAIIGN